MSQRKRKRSTKWDLEGRVRVTLAEKGQRMEEARVPFLSERIS